MYHGKKKYKIKNVTAFSLFVIQVLIPNGHMLLYIYKINTGMHYARSLQICKDFLIFNLIFF